MPAYEKHFRYQFSSLSMLHLHNLCLEPGDQVVVVDDSDDDEPTSQQPHSTTASNYRDIILTRSNTPKTE